MGAVTGRPGRDPGAGPQCTTGETALESLRRTQEILEYRKQGWTLAEIGAVIGIRPDNVQRRIAKWVKEQNETTRAEMQQVEAAKLDELERIAMDAVRTFVPLTSMGKVVYAPLFDAQRQPVLNNAGQPVMLPIQDKAPVIAAIATTLKIIERRAKLFGLDAPVKQAYLFEDADAITDVTFRVIDTAEDVKKLVEAAHDAGGCESTRSNPAHHF
jgi:DNA-binding transcriptional MerR regulator